MKIYARTELRRASLTNENINDRFVKVDDIDELSQSNPCSNRCTYCGKDLMGD